MDGTKGQFHVANLYISKVYTDFFFPQTVFSYLPAALFPPCECSLLKQNLPLFSTIRGSLRKPVKISSLEINEHAQNVLFEDKNNTVQ